MFNILTWVLVCVLVITFLASFGGRLLGIRQSWVRALLASVVGLVIGSLLAVKVAPQTPLPYPLFFVFAILLPALLASMAVSVLLELLARPGPLVRVQGRLATVPHPLRDLRRLVVRERRYTHITWLVARHGLAPFLFGSKQVSEDVEPPVGTALLIHNLRDVLEEAGGVFIKLGQVLSARSDLLPAAVIADLETLQDAAAPAPRAGMEALLTAELGATPASIFSEFEWEPVAAASIAQVYRARLLSGEQVAVKVQRPGIEALVEGDLDILLRLARMVEAGSIWGREFRVLDLARGFATSLREELDFRVEARNIAAVAAVSRTTSGVHIPKVYASLSTRRMLVTEWLDGKSAREAGPLMEELELECATLARNLLKAVLDQVMRQGTFHADPHPGNVLVLRSGQLGLLDFGSVGRIDPLQQAALRAIIWAIQRRDAAELRIALLGLAAKTPLDMNDELLERALAHFMTQHLGPGMEFGAAMLSQLTGLLLQFGIAFPPEIGAVFRALMTLEGTLRVLSPGFQIVDEIRTLARQWMRESFNPSSLGKVAGDELLDLLPLLRRLPRRLDRITEAIERGSLSVNVRLFADARDERLFSTLVSRAILALLGAALGLMSVLLLDIQTGPVLIAPIGLFQALGYLGLCVSLVLILRVVIALVRDRLV
ncbi:MAG TPA: AarF/UbiB family protein [Ktedonobacteraceae bacterium]|nr:AarF/UbiB family protein [Ktedonobacteraceae bacterium]